ncbi:hypothetical protein CASFOL_037727 [Castilleja foliolosa]|uniref:Uncharacterized protein n=1 Tax=Castilleja foliolosa TaxID=1961234 RepID=A0ABD3BIX9_9LAMI
MELLMETPERPYLCHRSAHMGIQIKSQVIIIKLTRMRSRSPEEKRMSVLRLNSGRAQFV